MLEQAKIRFKNLILDDSGVAMAWTLVVFLCFFMFCVSVFAVAENVRQRIIMQNACDNAAYSAAVIQADMLSRIAVLNRALSWTYAETNKRQMDFIVDRWLQEAVSVYNQERDSASSANAGACSHGGVSPVNGSRCSYSYCAQFAWIAGCRIGDDWYAEQINLNGRAEQVSNINSNIQRAANAQSDNINIGLGNLGILNSNISFLKRNLNSYIGKAVNNVMDKYSLPAADFRYITDGGVNNTADCTYLTAETSESDLLAYTDRTAATEFANGRDDWWVVNQSPANGIFRSYQQTGRLTATINAVAYSHNDDAYGNCTNVMTYNKQNGRTVQGSGVTDAVAKPFELTQEFFGSAGTIVVAAKKRMVNPFELLFGRTDSEQGAYGMFNLSRTTDMWVVSAARAGVRMTSDPEGFYRVQWPGVTISGHGYTNGVWNLCEEDWDAVMLPITRAWTATNTSGWDVDNDPRPLLSQVRNALSVVSSWNPAETDQEDDFTH